MDSTHWCEIVGNVTDNPDALKEKDEDEKEARTK
jgi:hypothetical protein